MNPVIKNLPGWKHQKNNSDFFDYTSGIRNLDDQLMEHQACRCGGWVAAIVFAFGFVTGLIAVSLIFLILN